MEIVEKVCDRYNKSNCEIKKKRRKERKKKKGRGKEVGKGN